MDELKIINTSNLLGKEIDVWGTAENPLFRASDVAEWLHNSNVSLMIKKVDEDEVAKFNLGSRQGETWFLTENGLYEVLMQSRKKEAKQFKKGVKAILHEIRTKGGYIAMQQDDTPEMIMARALRVADETIRRNEERVRQLEAQTQEQAAVIDQKETTIGLQKKELKVAAPKVKYYDDTLASTDCITATQIADDLGITARALNQKLAELGIQYFQSNSWHLKGKYHEWNLAKTRTYNFQRSDGSMGINVRLVWNQRGKRFIIALYNNNFNEDAAIAEINGEKEQQAAALAANA